MWPCPPDIEFSSFLIDIILAHVLARHDGGEKPHLCPVCKVRIPHHIGIRMLRRGSLFRRRMTGARMKG